MIDCNSKHESQYLTTSLRATEQALDISRQSVLQREAAGEVKRVNRD